MASAINKNESNALRCHLKNEKLPQNGHDELKNGS